MQHVKLKTNLKEEGGERVVGSGTAGIITHIEASADGTVSHYFIQVNADQTDWPYEDVPLIKATLEQIEGLELNHRMHRVFCNACGKVVTTDFNRFDGRVCDQTCHDQLEWIKVLSALNMPLQPMPTEAKSPTKLMNDEITKEIHQEMDRFVSGIADLNNFVDKTGVKVVKTFADGTVGVGASEVQILPEDIKKLSE